MKKNMVLFITIMDRFGTQADFADAVGLTESMASRIVRGRISPNPEQKRKIAEVLQVPADELFPPQDKKAMTDERNYGQPIACRGDVG